MKQKKLASRNATTAIMCVGILIMFVGGLFLSPPQAKYSTASIVCFIIGFVMLFWGVVRAAACEHEP